MALMSRATGPTKTASLRGVAMAEGRYFRGTLMERTTRTGDR